MVTSEAFHQRIKCQCCPHIETSQLTCSANQLTGLYMRPTLAFNGLRTFPNESVIYRFCYSQNLFTSGWYQRLSHYLIIILCTDFCHFTITLMCWEKKMQNMVSQLTPTYMLCIKETKGFKVINKNKKINIETQEPW